MGFDDTMKGGSSGRMSEVFDNMVTIPNEPAKKPKSIYKELRSELNGIPTHRYPIYIDNLNGANDVPMVQECIHFTAVKQGGISLESDAEISRLAQKQDEASFKKEMTDENGLTMMDKIGNGARKAVAEGVAGKKAATLAADGLRSLKEFTFDKAMSFGEEKLKQIRTPAKNLEHCFLYMPTSVQYNEGASWGAEALGGLGNLISQGLRGGTSSADLARNFAGGVVSKVAQAAALGTAAKMAGALGAVGTAGLTSGVGGGLRAAGRFVENPFEEQLFNGIDFRQFSFEFVFAPASEAEGNEVDAIIKMFRLNSRPNFVGGALGEGQYTFPNEFSIEFLQNEGGEFIQNFNIPYLHNCVCTNVTTNYTPEGFWSAYRDGRPVSYTLSLSFTETVKITQDDIDEDY